VQHESFGACSPRVRGLAVTAHGARTSAPATLKSAYVAAKPEARGGGARVQGDIEPWRISVYGYYDHRTMRRMDAAPPNLEVTPMRLRGEWVPRWSRYRGPQKADRWPPP
jgi:hypothetical protein